MARQFGHTWWGTAWLDALEGRALRNPNRLPRGRTYARQGRVLNPDLGPGQIHARVLGTETYSTSLYLPVLGDDQWDSTIEALMAEAGNVAALLAGELPEAVAETLLPAAGELGPTCSCPDSVELCKHAAALCYVAADLFDADPFALVALRGRDRQALLAEVRERRAASLGAAVGERSELPRGPDPGVNATAAWKRPPGESAGAAVVPMRPARPAPLAPAPPADSGVDSTELAALIGDAATRAWRMLAEGADSGLGLTPGADVVRRVAEGADHAAVAEATGVDANELRAAARAWRIAGHDGMTALRRRHEPSTADMAPGVAALADYLGPTGEPSDVRVRANRASINNTQIRLDESGRWWRFRMDTAEDSAGWLLTAGPAADPIDLFDE